MGRGYFFLVLNDRRTFGYFECNSKCSDNLGYFECNSKCLDRIEQSLNLIAAEPAFPCGDDNSNSSTTLADLVWGFSGPAAVRPGRWIGGFPGRRRSGRVGVGLGVFRAGGGLAGSALVWGFSGISVGKQ